MNQDKFLRQKCAFVQIELHQLNWAKELNDCVPQELLQWQLMEDFSPAIMSVATKRRIHVIPKPRSKKDEYFVVGGFIYFLHLCAASWDKKIECIIDPEIEQKDIKKSFLDDIQFSLFSTKGGSVSTAVNAAILVSLSDCAVENQHYLGVQAPYQLLRKRDKIILNTLVGFALKSFNMTSKDDVPHAVLDVISEILKLKSTKNKSTCRKNGNAETCAAKKENNELT